MNTSSHHKPVASGFNIFGNGVYKILMLVGGYGLIAALSLALLLPVLANTQEQDVRHRNTTQVRGIVQSLITYAHGNREKFPGVNDKAFILQDDGTADSLTGRSGHGATVEARYWLLLDTNSFGGDYLISPAETKTAWTSGPVTAANYSYAMLNIHSEGGILDHDRVRPDQVGRAREWKVNGNHQAVLISDRARVSWGRIGAKYNSIFSIHTQENSMAWAGSVGRGDGGASFHYVDVHDTKYGSAPLIENDRLFSIYQDSSRNIDVLSYPGNHWNKTSNALLGYTSVGYEDDDIASD